MYFFFFYFFHNIIPVPFGYPFVYSYKDIDSWTAPARTHTHTHLNQTTCEIVCGGVDVRTPHVREFVHIYDPSVQCMTARGLYIYCCCCWGTLRVYDYGDGEESTNAFARTATTTTTTHTTLFSATSFLAGVGKGVMRGWTGSGGWFVGGSQQTAGYCRDGYDLRFAPLVSRSDGVSVCVCVSLHV